MPLLKIVLILFALSSVSSAMAETIKKIQISGNERVESQTILTYLPVKQGDFVRQNDLDNAVKALFDSGFFSDVSVKETNNTLFVNVIENPLINRIRFEGNDKVETDSLESEISLRPRIIFTRSKLQNDIDRLYQIYKRNGRFSVKIDPKIIERDQNRVDLVFEIIEGDITKINSIRFIGNEVFSDDKLRKQLASREKAWFRFLTNNDRFDPDRFAFDQELLRQFYLNNGYADFQITSVSSELSSNQDDFYLTLTVKEGEKYTFGKTKIDSKIPNFDANILTQDIFYNFGDTYSAEVLDRVADDFLLTLEENRVFFANVRPETTKIAQDKRIDILYTVTETAPVFVERINIRGNSRTQDRVIRRQFEVNEGDKLVRKRLSRSERNIRNLNYFQSVDIQRLQGSSPDKAIIDIEVTEQSTGEISIGAGFSTNDGPLADFRIRERNFLGKGQIVALGATVAGERTEFDFSFTEPFFLQRDISAGIDLFSITRDLQTESSFDQSRTGAGLRLGYPLSEDLRQSLGYRYEDNSIQDVDPNASRFIREQQGDRATSAINQRLTYNTLNNRLNPTEGIDAWFETEFAGLAGDAKYLSARIGGQKYFPITDSWNFNILSEVGAIEAYGDEAVRINERYFLGGVNSFRGFAQGGIGPRDVNTNDALGGNYFYRTAFEISAPAPLPETYGIRTHLFTDIGSLWSIDNSGPEIQDESSVRASAGLGVSWQSPLGPLRLDFALPYAKEDFDEEEFFQFSFGTRF